LDANLYLILLFLLFNAEIGAAFPQFLAGFAFLRVDFQLINDLYLG